MALCFLVVKEVGGGRTADPVFDCSQPVAVVVAAVLVVRFTPSMIAHMLVCVDVNGVSMTSMVIVIGVSVVVGWGEVVGEVDVVSSHAVGAAHVLVVVTLSG